MSKRANVDFCCWGLGRWGRGVEVICPGFGTTRAKAACAISGVESVEALVDEMVRVGEREREKMEEVDRDSVSESAGEERSIELWLPYFECPFPPFRIPRSSMLRPREEVELCLLDCEARSRTSWIERSRASFSSARARFSSASWVTRSEITVSRDETCEARSSSWERRDRTRVSASSASSLSTSRVDWASMYWRVRS